MPSVFQNLFSQLTPEECLFYSDWHGFAAIPDKFPRLPYQSVVLSERPFKEGEEVVGDLPARDRLRMHAVADAVQKSLQSICYEEQRAITHVEGYALPDDPHIVIYQSPIRKSGEALYTGPVIEWPIEKTLAALSIRGAAADLLNRELDMIDTAFPLIGNVQL